MKIIGIDPGLKGGIAILEDGNIIFADYTPVYSEDFIKGGKKKTRNIMDVAAISDIMLEFKPDCGILEKVTARPGQGSTSMFRFGMGVGEYHGLLTALTIPYKEIRPQEWKKHFNLTSDKVESLNLATTLWPDWSKSFRLKKQDGIAEAALMAKYGITLFV